MKSCKYCSVRYGDELNGCPSCSATEFNYVCQNCSTLFDSKFCPGCGKAHDEEIKSCPNCGNRTTELFCAKCGTSLARNNPMQPPPPVVVPQYYPPPQVVNNYYTQQPAANYYPGKQCSKWVAFFLCLCLGYFGAHKFYEGRTKMGILYFLTLGLLGVGWLIDCIILLFKSNPYYVK